MNGIMLVLKVGAVVTVLANIRAHPAIAQTTGETTGQEKTAVENGKESKGKEKT
jgi:hypothetical protein